MNNLVELEDGPWFATSLGMSGSLNAQFNKSWGSLACKSTDVPGMSRSTIPYFAAAGKASLHMGYNGNCRVPDIPQAFNWVHTETGSSLLTFVNNNYGSVITVPGSSHALVFYYSMDNTGPPVSAAAVTSWWMDTQMQYPNAQVILSSLDDFTKAILPMTESIPQVVGEIGQSWNYGAPADPLKVATFRAARRLRNEGVIQGWLDASDSHLLAYERRLWVGGPEHNWGLCFGCYLGSERGKAGHWSNAEFHPLRPTPPFQFIESGNEEKRNFTAPLPLDGTESPGYLKYLTQLGETIPALLPLGPPDLTGFTPVADPSAPILGCGRFSSLTLNTTSGAIVSLVDASTGFDFVGGEGHTLGAFSYRTYTEDNFDIFNREYNPRCGRE